MKNIKLTKKLLNQLNVCADGMSLFRKNNIYNLPIYLLDEITGDYEEVFEWLRTIKEIELDNNSNLCHYSRVLVNGMCYDVWKKYDANDNLIYHKDSTGLECNYTLDGAGNIIHYINTKNNMEYWITYDDKNNEIHYKDVNGTERWKKYDSNSNMIYVKCVYDNGDINKEWKEYDNKNNLIFHRRLKAFKYWREYDDNGNMIKHINSDGTGYECEHGHMDGVYHYKDSMGYEYWRKLDEFGNVVFFKDSDGFEESNTIEHYSDGQLKKFNDLIIPYFVK